MWIIGGIVEIERLGARVGEFMRFPFNLSIPGPEQPTFADIQQLALEQANEFLGLLQDTMPGHRADYGQPQNVVVSFATFQF